LSIEVSRAGLARAASEPRVRSIAMLEVLTLMIADVVILVPAANSSIGAVLGWLPRGVSPHPGAREAKVGPQPEPCPDHEPDSRVLRRLMRPHDPREARPVGDRHRARPEGLRPLDELVRMARPGQEGEVARDLEVDEASTVVAIIEVASPAARAEVHDGVPTRCMTRFMARRGSWREEAHGAKRFMA